MLQHLCINSHVRELDEHLNAPSELCTFISQKQYIRLIPSNIRTTHVDVNVDIHLAFWKLMKIMYRGFILLVIILLFWRDYTNYDCMIFIFKSKCSFLNRKGSQIKGNETGMITINYSVFYVSHLYDCALSSVSNIWLSLGLLFAEFKLLNHF